MSERISDNNGVEEMIIEDSVGRLYYAARAPSFLGINSFARGLLDHLKKVYTSNSLNLDYVKDSLVVLDGGKHTSRFELVYDPYQTIRGDLTIVVK